MICFWGLSEIGKTPAIKTIWQKLKNGSNPPLDTSSDDICDIVYLDGHKIGIESQGDPDSKQKEWIDELIKEECEIIICATSESIIKLIKILTAK